MGKLNQELWLRVTRDFVVLNWRQGVCYQWKAKNQCSQRDRCSFRHEAQDRAQKPEHTAATPSEPTVS